MTDIENIKAIVEAFDAGRKALTKLAFTPTAAPAPPATAMPPQGPPPGDPGMMPPPGDPGMAPPPGAPMPPPGDPNAMPPQGPPPGDPGMMPPGDPNAMPPQGPPPPPPAGGIPPELEGALSQLAGGMDTVSQTVEQQQAQTDQLSQRMLAMEEELNNMRAELKGPAPFEGTHSTPADAPSPNAGAPTAR